MRTKKQTKLNFLVKTRKTSNSSSGNSTPNNSQETEPELEPKSTIKTPDEDVELIAEDTQPEPTTSHEKENSAQDIVEESPLPKIKEEPGIDTKAKGKQTSHKLPVNDASDSEDSEINNDNFVNDVSEDSDEDYSRIPFTYDDSENDEDYVDDNEVQNEVQNEEYEEPYEEQNEEQNASIYQNDQDYEIPDESQQYNQYQEIELDEDNLPKDISLRMQVLFDSDEESDSGNSEKSFDGLRKDEDALFKSTVEGSRYRINQHFKNSAANVINHEARIYLELAKEEYEAGNIQDAILLIEEAILADNEARLPYILLDIIHTDLGNHEAALKAKIAAATAGGTVLEDWIDVAERSFNMGYYSQATTFYLRAVDLKRNDPELRWKLIEAYIALGDYKHAAKNARKLHQKYPAESEFTSILGKLYLKTNQIQEAVTLYEDILAKSMESTPIDISLVHPFGFSELNVLCELYEMQQAWSKGIHTIKSVSRRLLDRKEETWWDDIPDDSEFDDRRFKNSRFAKSQFYNDPSKFYLPLDIRAKLLTFRLEKGDKKEALIHAGFLLNADVNEYVDLLWEAGMLFSKHHDYKTSLRLFTAIMNNNQDEVYATELLLAVAKCELELELYTEARQHLEMVVEADPKNTEALVGLGEVTFLLDDVAASRHYAGMLSNIIQQSKLEMNEVHRKKRATILSRPDDEIKSSVISSTTQVQNDESSFIQHIPYIRKTRSLAVNDRKRLQEEIKKHVLQLYDELHRHWQYIIEAPDNLAAVIKWKQIAHKLMEQILSTKNFTYGKRIHLYIDNMKDHNTIEDRLNILENKILQDDIDNIEEEEAENDEIMSELNSRQAALRSENEMQARKEMIFRRKNIPIRGLTTEQWFTIFMQYALVAAKYNKDAETSYRVLAAANSFKIFKDDGLTETIPLVKLVCAYFAEDYRISSDSLRGYLIQDPYINDIYRLQAVILSSGIEKVNIYRGANFYKSFQRRLRFVQSHSKKSVQVYIICSYTALLNRSYILALGYLKNALDIAPNEPLIHLLMGVCNISRALNRLSRSRHTEILQGFSNLAKYYELRSKEGEKSIEDEKNFRLKLEKSDTTKNESNASVPKNVDDEGDVEMEEAGESENNDIKSSSKQQERTLNGDAESLTSYERDIMIDGDDAIAYTNWEEQEAEYNMGRAYHGLGLHNEASRCYERVLANYPDVVSTKEQLEYTSKDKEDIYHISKKAATYTMKPNAAYNLVSIYAASGNNGMAREIVDKYLVI